jgi:hypothetical protein
MGVVIKQLTDVLQMVGAGSDLGKDVLKAMSILTKHVPSGSVTPADERNQLERQMMQNTQNTQQSAQLKQQMAQPQQQAG